jgi:hypothetical protein
LAFLPGSAILPRGRQGKFLPELEVDPFDFLLIHQVTAFAFQAYLAVLQDVHPFHEVEGQAGASCSTIKTVSPLFQMVLMPSTRRFFTKGERPMEGSSNMRRRGLDIRDRPMASICCSPPLRLPAS